MRNAFSLFFSNVFTSQNEHEQILMVQCPDLWSVLPLVPKQFSFEMVYHCFVFEKYLYLGLVLHWMKTIVCTDIPMMLSFSLQKHFTYFCFVKIFFNQHCIALNLYLIPLHFLKISLWRSRADGCEADPGCLPLAYQCFQCDREKYLAYVQASF